jgi:N-acetylmuramoyl-L-alanine amidase
MKWFQNPESDVSCHVLLGKQSEVVQLVPFDQRAWSCGDSEWQGRKSVNGFSINIEFDNFGILQIDNAGRPFTWFDEPVEPDSYISISGRAWEKYPQDQILTGARIVRAIIDEYPSITHVVGHCDVSPGRKVDPGLAFPWEKFCNLVDRKEIKFHPD